MQPKIIALTGAKTVGKSTVARELKRVLLEKGTDCERLSFADPMRAMLHSLGVMPHDYLDKEATIDGLGVSARHLMQTLGTTWGRGCVGENVWIWSLEKRIKMLEQVYADERLIVIIDDCRFPNEAEWVRNCGGSVVRLSREGVEYTGEHVTEQPLQQSLIDLEVDCGDIEGAVKILKILAK